MPLVHAFVGAGESVGLSSARTFPDREKLPTGLVFWLAQQAALEGALASVLDYSGLAHHFSVDAAATKRPIGTPMLFSCGAKPAFITRSRDLQYAKYGGVVGDLPKWQADDFTILIEGVHHQQTDIGALFTTWSGSSSNENAIDIETSSERVQLFITSTAGGGTVHLSRQTAVDTLRVGDRYTLVWRRLGTSSKFYLRRRSRFPGDPEVITTHTDVIGGTPNTGASVSVPVIGAYRGLATGLADADYVDVMTWNRSLSDAELTQMVDGQRKYDFPFRAYRSSRPLIFNVDIGAGAGGGADNTHPANLGQAKVGHCLYDNQAALAVTLRFLSGTLFIATVGDSRMNGSNATDATTTARAVRHADAVASAPYTDTEIGVASGLGGFTFALSAMIERAKRTLFAASPGWSERTHDSTNSADNFFGSGKPNNDVHIVHYWLGVNDIGQATSTGAREFNFMYERYKDVHFIRDNALQYAGHDVGFSFVNEPITGVTTTGPLQREAYARNRDMHCLVGLLLEQGFAVEQSNIHDDTYNS